MVPYRSASKINQSETTLKYFDNLCKHIITTHTHTHTHTHWLVCQTENKIKSRKNLNSLTALRAEPALSLYGDLLPYYPYIKFLGITFDNRMTFTKHFEEILERYNRKFHRLKILVNEKWSPSLKNFANLQTMCKTNIRIWDCFYHNCLGNCHHKNIKSPELFH